MAAERWLEELAQRAYLDDVAKYKRWIYIAGVVIMGAVVALLWYRSESRIKQLEAQEKIARMRLEAAERASAQPASGDVRTDRELKEIETSLEAERAKYKATQETLKQVDAWKELRDAYDRL